MLNVGKMRIIAPQVSNRQMSRPFRPAMGTPANQDAVRFGAEKQTRQQEFEEVIRNTNLWQLGNQLLYLGSEALDADDYKTASARLSGAVKLIKEMSFDHPDHVSYPKVYFTKSHERQKLERVKLQLKTMTYRLMGDTIREMGQPNKAIKQYKAAFPAAHALARENHERMWEPKSLYARIAQAQIQKGDYPSALNTLMTGMSENARYRDALVHDDEFTNEEDKVCSYMAEKLTRFLLAQIYFRGMGKKASALKQALEENAAGLRLHDNIPDQPNSDLDLLQQRAAILHALNRHAEAERIDQQVERKEAEATGTSDAATQDGKNDDPSASGPTLPKNRLEFFFKPDGTPAPENPDGPFSRN